MTSSLKMASKASQPRLDTACIGLKRINSCRIHEEHQSVSVSPLPFKLLRFFLLLLSFLAFEVVERGHGLTIINQNHPVQPCNQDDKVTVFSFLGNQKIQGVQILSVQSNLQISPLQNWPNFDNLGSYLPQDHCNLPSIVDSCENSIMYL